MNHDKSTTMDVDLDIDPEHGWVYYNDGILNFLGPYSEWITWQEKRYAIGRLISLLKHQQRHTDVMERGPNFIRYRNGATDVWSIAIWHDKEGNIVYDPPDELL